MAASGEAKIRAGETMEFTVSKADLSRLSHIPVLHAGRPNELDQSLV